MASRYDLASMYAYIEGEFAKPRRGESADCSKLRQELKPILLSLVAYAKLGGAGIDELAEDHHDEAVAAMGMADTMPADHRRRFQQAGQRDLTLRPQGGSIDDLPPNLKSLYLNGVNEQASETSRRHDHRS